MDEDIFFDDMLHVNKFAGGFDLNSEENKHIKDNLIISFEGTIVGVKRAAVQAHINSPDVRRIRLGLDRMPSKFVIENEDEFYKLLAILTPLSQS